MTDAYQGTGCTYIGKLPQCPHCGGGTMAVSTEELIGKNGAFESGNYKFNEYDTKNQEPPNWKPHPHPGFIAMLYWATSQPHCYKHIMHLRNSYKKHVGIDVDMTV